VPDGIIKSNWVFKHSEKIPFVVVVFFDVNWSTNSWNENQMKNAKVVKDLK